MDFNVDFNEPDRTQRYGRIHVDLWRGIFRDQVRVWLDVRPAAGGLLEKRSCWRGRGDDLFEQAVSDYDKPANW